MGRIGKSFFNQQATKSNLHLLPTNLVKLKLSCLSQISNMRCHYFTLMTKLRDLNLTKCPLSTEAGIHVLPLNLERLILDENKKILVVYQHIGQREQLRIRSFTTCKKLNNKAIQHLYLRD